jgi:hypothetical protein
VPNAFRAKEQSVVQVVISFAPVRKRFPRVENERQIQPEITDTSLERQKWLDIVGQWPQCIFTPDEIKPGDQTWKLLL